MRGVAFLAGAMAAAICAGGAVAAASRGAVTTRGYILSVFQHAAYDDEAVDCPDGMNASGPEYYLANATAAERVRFSGHEGKTALERFLFNGARGILDWKTPNACNTPLDFVKPGYYDPAFKTVRGKIAYGLDLDGAASPEVPAAGSCAHDEFAGPAGEPGIDNQWWRLMGCIKYYRPGGDIQRNVAAVMGSGELTIAIEVTGIDDPANDPDVSVGIYSSADAAPTDASGRILSGGSVEPHPDLRYHAFAQGRIVNSVLTTDPVDVHLRFQAMIIDTEWWLRNARLRLELSNDGTARGLIAGYFDVETFYEYIRQSNMSVSILGGYTCPSLYLTAQRLADGFPDPATGRCTALSAAYRIEAVPGFVIHPKAPATDSGRSQAAAVQ